MFVLSNFILAMAKVVDILLTFLYWLILIRALISWVNPDPYNPIVQFLYRATEPILEPIRRLLPRTAIDFSALIAFFIIIFLQGFLVDSLRELGYRMRKNDSPFYSQLHNEPMSRKGFAVYSVGVKDKDRYV